MARHRKYATNAERVAAHRERNDTAQLCVDLPRELLTQFNEWLRFKDRTKNEVVESLLRNQLLRKR